MRQDTRIDEGDLRKTSIRVVDRSIWRFVKEMILMMLLMASLGS
jgi:hypothetical protein